MFKYIFSKTECFMGLTQASVGLKIYTYIYSDNQKTLEKEDDF